MLSYAYAAVEMLLRIFSKGGDIINQQFHKNMSWAIRRLLRGAMHVFSWFVVPYSYLVTARIHSLKLPPIQNPLLQIPAVTLAAKIRTGQIKSAEVVTAYIERCRQVNPILNAIVQDRFEEALEEAKRIDEEVAKGLRSEEQMMTETPILGIPVTIKESLAVKGMSNTGGRKLKNRRIAEQDSPVVERIRKSGGVILLVSNTPELCLCWETYNKCTGLTKNPYNLKRTVGGSSGGEAALISSAASLIGVTTDIAGSSRLPAAFVGVFGHKPSPFSVSPYGHNPSCEDESWGNFFTPGAMCRYAEDLPLLLTAMHDPSGAPLSLNTKINLTDINYYYMENDGPTGLTEPIQPDIQTAINDVVNYFNAEKVHLKRLIWSLDISICKMLRMKNIETIYTQQHDGQPKTTVPKELLKYFFGCSDSDLPSVVIGPMQHIVQNYIPSSRLTFLDQQTELLRKDFIDLLGDKGVFIYPVFPNTAHRHFEIFHKLVDTSYMMVFNTLGFPAASCMVGLDRNKLPIGVQIVASPGQDHLIFAVAQELERKYGGWVPPPS